jgi:gas vesicle protein
MGKRGSFKDLLLGVGVGVVIGALFTPRTGEENRKLLKEKANETVDKVKKIDFEALKTKLYDEYYNLKDELENMDSETAQRIAKEKVSELQAKADKVIAAAIEENKPKVEKSLVELKKKLAVVLKEASKKLEA